MAKRPEFNLRFENKAQLDRIRRAARLRKWSINQFVTEAADQAAQSLTAAKSSDPLMVKSSNLALNQ